MFVKKQRLLSYFYNKEKYEQRTEEIEEAKKSIHYALIEFLKGKPYHFTVYSQEKK